MFNDADYVSELRRCIHCGLCLQACPTYVVLGNESDSPRGRLTLLRAAAEGAIELPAQASSFHRHLDLCLQCRACEIECPSGVQYGALVQTAQETMVPPEPMSLVRRFIQWLGLRFTLPHPRRLRLLARLLWLYQVIGLQFLVRRFGFLPRRLEAMEELLPPLQRSTGWNRITWPAEGLSRGRVAFFTGCVQDAFLPYVNRATVEILQHLGFDVEITVGQTCCGAAHAHSRDREKAVELARQNIDAFLATEYVAVISNAGGCCAMLKDEYPRLFDHDPHYQARARAFSAKVRDIHDFAFDYGFQPSRSLEMTVTYAESCHLRNVLRVTAPPRELLRRTPGLRYVPLRGDHCCGSAGIYNLVYPDMADELLTRKVKSIAESGADVVAVSNTGCHLHLLRGIRKAGLKCRVMHTTEILSLACRSDGSDRAERGKV